MCNISAISLTDDTSNFALCLNHTFQVYSTNPIHRKFQKEFQQYDLTNISTTMDGSLTAFVAKGVPGGPPTAGSPKGAAAANDKNRSTVFLWNNLYSECQSKIDFYGKITSIRLIPQLLLIVLENSFCVYNIQTKAMQLEQKTFANPNGAADICMSEDVLLLAVCAPKSGVAQVLEYGSVNPPINFQAAKHPITLLKFCPDGSLIATASEKGTLIRVFDSATGAPLSVFRRGALTSSVLTMCFSPSNSELVAISENGTIHLFEADKRNATQGDPPRAIAKTKVERAKTMTAAYRTDNELIVVASSGHIYTIKCQPNHLEILKKAYVFEH